jgi:VanZ family protein
LPSSKFKTAILILLVAATVIVGHLLPGLDNSRVEDGIRNGLHILVFAAVAVVFLRNLRSLGLSSFVAALVTLLGVAIVGASAEYLQYLSGRQPDALDIARDVGGAALAVLGNIAWHSADRGDRPGLTNLIPRVIAVFAGGLIVMPLTFWLSIIVLGRLSAPVIVDFDQWWNQHIYRPINAEIISTGGVHGPFEIELLKRGRSGIVISPMMTDWRGYEVISVTAVMSAGPDTNVTVKINDSERKNNWSDQFIASIVVKSNRSTIRIPLTDLVTGEDQPDIDLSDIQELVIFARDRRRGTSMVIDNIRLE